MSREFNKEITKLTESLMKTIVQTGPYTNLSLTFVPSRSKIIEIINDLRKLLFPRHYAEREIFNCSLEYYIGNLMSKVEEQLHKQIGIALMREQDFRGHRVTQEVANKAAKLSVDFMKKLPKIHDMLALDIKAFFDGDPAAQSIDEIVLSYPGMFAIMVYRLAHELYEMKIPVIPRMMSEYAHNITGVDINPGAKIGKYFFIDHATGVVIGETCEIADHVKLYQGVTLGALSTKGGQLLQGVKRHPTIEDNVTIYANATILGGDTVIGKDAVIGGSCFITKSVPPGAKVETVSQIRMKGFDDFEIIDFIDGAGI